jgi:aconitate hydratase
LFENVPLHPEPMRDLRGARILAMYGDMVTTEHISPMGPIPDGSPAADYLASLGIAHEDFVSYAARRINHDVMTRGTFASPHLVNELTPGAPGGLTRHMPDDTRMTVFDAAERYRREGVPLVVIAGHSFGAGSSRDWSAKGPQALGVRAVIAESFERIYRANLVAAGVLPLQFVAGESRKSLRLDGSEAIDIMGLDAAIEPLARLRAVFARAGGGTTEFQLIARLDTAEEVDCFLHAGLLRRLLRKRLLKGERD